MAELQTSTPIRGAIKTAVSTSTDNLVAGEEFSIFVTIQNPFEVPITLHRVSTYLPTEFLDVDQHFRELQVEEVREQAVELRELATELGLDTSSLPIPKRRSWWEKFLRDLSLVSVRFLGIQLDFRRKSLLGPAIARNMTSTLTTREISAGISIPMIGDVRQTIRREIGHETPSSDQEARLQQERLRREVIQKELDRYQTAIEAIRNPDESAKPMQPGNSTTQTFTVKSRKRIWFKPATYKLNIEIEYEIGGVRNLDTIEHTIHVRSPLSSMILGALVGGVGGWFTSTGSTVTLDFANLISLGSSLLFAAMAVVLFARKKDIQPLIAVEDFWGGVAIGFIVAYTGPRLIQGLIDTG